ncbi:MAG: hypothetical protein PHV33_09180 [Elusimicrobiales bacterium]|nr:hypothetical protein [Elusimicrobiales bacterium]
MKHLELMAKDKNSVMYHVKDYALIDDKLIASVDWPRSVPVLFFDFKPFRPSGGVLKHKVKGPYIVRCVFGGYGKSLKPAGKRLKNSPITAREPENLKEALDITKKSIAAHAAADGRMYGRSFKAETKRYLAAFKKTRSVLLFKGDRNVGIATLYDNRRWDGKPCSTITWLRLDRRLPKPQYQDALYQATKWCVENCKETMAVFNHISEAEDHKFETAMGLRPYRINFRRK